MCFKVIDKKISIKKLAIYALEDGGTKEQGIEPKRQNRQTLTDEQILRLDRIGRTIEFVCMEQKDVQKFSDENVSSFSASFFVCSRFSFSIGQKMVVKAKKFIS